jgi:hypothetical protein
MGIDRPEKLRDFHQLFAADWYSGEWSLTVFAISSGQRSLCRELLQAVGLPAVRDWLRASRQETWFIGMRRFEVGFSPRDRVVGLLESKDHRTFAWRVLPRTQHAPADRPRE